MVAQVILLSNKIGHFDLKERIDLDSQKPKELEEK